MIVNVPKCPYDVFERTEHFSAAKTQVNEF